MGNVDREGNCSPPLCVAQPMLDEVAD